MLFAAGICRAADPGPKTLEELKTAVEKVLRETRVPGMGLAIVTRDKVLFADGIGMAYPEAHRAATADTLFRIGSVTKGFTSLAILQLQEQGRLSLDDPVRKYAPEVWYRNDWEATDPIRIVHLLEHTTGWDDMHFAEYANNDSKPLTLAEGLALHPDSRVSRWRPGTRMAYTNSGPSVAAFVVEKITGQRFEDYVRENLFQPIHMDSASYLYTPEVARKITGLFGHDGRSRSFYWHISVRPSGAINASPRDMANYVRFYLNRGRADGAAIVNPQSISRMEHPESTMAARAGLRAGYGLSNYTDVDQHGFVWHGHNGSIAGGLTTMAYLPEEGVGYAFMINATNGEASARLEGLLQGYLTRDFKLHEVPPPVPGGAKAAAAYVGWYEPASPRSQYPYFFNRIGGLRRVTVNRDALHVAEVGQSANEYVYAGGNLWRDSDSSFPETILIPPTPEGAFLVSDTEAYRRVPTWKAWFELALTGLCLVLGASSIVFALYWIPAAMLRQGTRPHLSVRLLPLLAILSLTAAVAVQLSTGDDVLTIQRLGTVSPWSVSILILTTLYPVLTVGASIHLWRARRWKLRRAVFVHSLLVTAACLVVALYLGYWGKLVVRTWS
jgi:CubicO group peptidase (beta-lactamase class C family)